MKRSFVYLLFVFMIFISINIKANAEDNSIMSMINSMQIEDIADISISDDNSTMTFMQLAENYANIIMNKNATPEQLEALGNIIKMWMDTIAENSSKEQMFDEYSRLTSTLSCMSIHLILRIAIKDNNIPTESAQKNIYETINNKFIPSFADFKNDGWKTEFNFYVINMSAAVCKWYEDNSKKLDYPDFKVWRDGSF
ncbi:hypothetical protein Q5M87_05935 [Brachyspira innocens]|uniref:Uncharacterized protein n=2 Tax=Brachyspira innocens TaxID=13264 RepID=A0ABT8YW88_9SPIR|nr:hypothetical protein [Brachyspira innocens]MDO6993547.1 hypothetical protein [Brachyspira innocens]MDO7019876.1 hypothetical protein [Brachyspira innocens]